ncbi:MAG: hypothetical protein Kow00127_13700 [Bacteroidales bacterium]
MRYSVIVLTLLSLIYFPPLQAQYVTPGTGVKWSFDQLAANAGNAFIKEGDTYYAQDDLIVSPADTLFQNEGCVVKFSPQVLWTVQGVLLCMAPDTVKFLPLQEENHFKGLKFEDSFGSVLDKVAIVKGGGIKLVGSGVIFRHSPFRFFDQSNCTGTIDLFQSSPVIDSCSFYMNDGPALLSAANGLSSPVISHCSVIDNVASNSNMPQINLGTTAAGEPAKILNNYIHGAFDKAGGIAVATLAGGSADCIIQGNTITHNRYGITIYGFDITYQISENVISDNNIENLPMQGGSGINFWGGPSTTGMVSENEIFGNLWGITITGEALPNLGQVEPDTLNPGKNLIYDNENLGTVYALYNNTPNDIVAENNYWGSYDPDSVEAVIFHQPDDPALGFVDYIPIKSYITGMDDAKSTGCLVYPNPATDEIYSTGNGHTPAGFRYELFNLSGTKCAEGVSSDGSIPVSGLPPGIYVVKAGFRFGDYSFKFEKK